MRMVNDDFPGEMLKVLYSLEELQTCLRHPQCHERVKQLRRLVHYALLRMKRHENLFRDLCAEVQADLEDDDQVDLSAL
jgi:hypothetical protein